MNERKLPPPASIREQSATTSFLYILLTWMLIVATLAAAITWNHLAGYLAAFVMIGVLQYHLNILGHDGIHYSLAKNKRLNDFACRFLLHGPQSAPLTLLRKNHLLHHRLLGSDADPDKNYYRVDRFSSKEKIAFWLSSSFVGGNTLPLIGKLIGRSKNQNIELKKPATTLLLTPGLISDAAGILCTQVSIAIAITWASGSIVYYFLLWVAPLFSIMFGLNTLRSCLEHVEVSSNLPATRQHRYNSFQSNLIERFFLSPYSMNCHAEHHYWPSVPFHRLLAARTELLAAGTHPDFKAKTRYHNSYTSRLREVLKRPHSENPD